MRKLSLAIVCSMALVAIGAGSAQAAYEVRDYSTGEPCPELQVSGNTVTGGCLVEQISGPWEVWAGGWPVESCSSAFGIRIDAVGNFYGVNTSASCSQLWRKACQEEATGEQILWPGALSGPWGPPAMGMCVENGDGHGGHVQVYMEFELVLGENGELFQMLQTNEAGGVKDAEFTNYDPEAILITTTP